MRTKLEIHSKYALASCLIVLGIVAVVSISWVIGEPEIAGFGAGYIPMAPLTAILFCFLSLTTITQIVGPRGAVNRVLCYVFLAVVGTLSILDLIDFCLGDPLDFEAPLLPNPEPFGKVMVGRISPIASACFLLATTASGLLTYFRGNRKSVFNDVISILVSILIFANIVFILGYIYGAPLLYGGTVIPVGLSTAIAFIFLGGAIIFVNGPDQLPLSLFTGPTTRATLLRAFVPTTVLLVIGSNVFMVYTKSHLHIHDALLSAISTLVAMLVTGIVIFQIAHQIGNSLDKAESALRESEQRFKSIFENSLDGIFLSSSHGDILKANPAACAMLDRQEGDILASRRDSFVELDDPAYHESLETRRLTGRFRGEVNFKRKDGSTFPADIASVTFEDTTGDIRAITVVRDISERKTAEMERENLRAQLFQSQKMEALGTLVGGLAHDFNNMLQIMVGYAEVLLLGKKEGDRDYVELQTIFKTAQQEAELVKRLITFAGKGPVKKIPVDLNFQVKELAAMLSPSFPTNIEINLDLQKELSHIMADPGQIDQAIINLVINGQEAMPNGGILKLQTRDLNLDDDYYKANPVMKPGDYVVLSVTDTGRGMDQETLARVFEPFFSTKQRDSRRGTGLGLSVVQGIAEKHGGFITCESEIGKGTEFKVFLPSIEPEA
ncbi:MAG: two-component system sensor histidine kinase NtrB [Desulfomonilaceae bacterium]